MRARIRLSLEIFRQASRAIDPSQCSFDDPSFRQDDEARDLFVRAFDDRDGNAAGLESRPLRLVALIAAIDKGHGHPRAFTMHRAEQRREGVTILNAGGGDLTFYRQTERIDGDMSFAALDFLPASKPRGPPASVVLTDWLSTTTAVGAGSRPSASRAAITNTLMIWGHSPLSRHA